MWLSQCQQRIRRKLEQSLGATMLWRLPGWILLASSLGFFCVLILFVVAAAFGLMVWKERQYQMTWDTQDQQLVQIIDATRPLLVQGSWLGITVMPALAAKLPVPGLKAQLEDLQFLNQLLNRFEAAEVQIHPWSSKPLGQTLGEGVNPKEEQSLWRTYEISFRMDAGHWLALLVHLSSSQGITLQRQEWSEEGRAALKLGMVGELPESVVGQVRSHEGESRLVLRNGRLQRVSHTVERTQENAH